jgi:hypothetical protein
MSTTPVHQEQTAVHQEHVRTTPITHPSITSLPASSQDVIGYVSPEQLFSPNGNNYTGSTNAAPPSQYSYLQYSPSAEPVVSTVHATPGPAYVWDPNPSATFTSYPSESSNVPSYAPIPISPFSQPAIDSTISPYTVYPMQLQNSLALRDLDHYNSVGGSPLSTESRPQSSDSNVDGEVLDEKTFNEIMKNSPPSGMCPVPNCGKEVKDIKVHITTHLPVRPEEMHHFFLSLL